MLRCFLRSVNLYPQAQSKSCVTAWECNWERRLTEQWRMCRVLPHHQKCRQVYSHLPPQCYLAEDLFHSISSCTHPNVLRPLVLRLTTIEGTGEFKWCASKFQILPLMIWIWRRSRSEVSPPSWRTWTEGATRRSYCRSLTPGSRSLGWARSGAAATLRAGGRSGCRKDLEKNSVIYHWISESDF